MKPMVRPNGWVATTTHHTVNVPRPPITARTGTDILPTLMLIGVRNGLACPAPCGAARRRETCATVNEIIAPNA